MTQKPDIINFIHNTKFDDLPADVVAMAERCCLDLIGVAVAGRQMRTSKIITNHAETFFAAGKYPSGILFSDKVASPVGAALADGMTIDSFDAHDGHRMTKGHAGAAVLPALQAYVTSLIEAGHKISGKEYLCCLVIGYEVSLRAGIALHATVPDYHTSGAWNTIGCAAVGARLLKLDYEQTRHALGIAEYHGPRSQMMRCIDHTTMLKDGSGWGAMAGVSAAYLAQSGFTGAPAITLEGVAAEPFWAELGNEWEFLQQYFKPYPVCRWAQPAVQAISDLIGSQPLSHHDIESINITTFHEALRLAGHAPKSSDEAQYAIAFPVAALIIRGELGAKEISEDNLGDSNILDLSRKISISESADYNALFPAQRWADVKITLKSGEIIQTPATCPIGDPENALSDNQVNEKFVRLCAPELPDKITQDIMACVKSLKSSKTSLHILLNLLRHPIAN